MKLIRHPPFILKPPRTPRERLGVRYEQKVHSRLQEVWGLDHYFPSQWFTFGDGDRVYYFQPDAILLLEDPRRIAILEVKYQHTVEAFWQLEHYYLPLLREFFRRAGRDFATVEICKWYDPCVAFPRPVKLLENLHQARPGDFNVHILNRPENRASA